MVTPLYSLFDIATQPRRSSMFHLHRLSGKLRNFSKRDFKQYSAKLGSHLTKEFRVTKPANRDATLGICREIEDDIEEDEAAQLLLEQGGGGGMGLFVVFEARVAPDHAKHDGQLGPRTHIAEVVLCLGEEEDEDGEGSCWRFAFALTRGNQQQVVNSVVAFIESNFGGVLLTPNSVAPHHLVHLAHTWSQDLEHREEEIRQLRKAKKLRKLNFLELGFLLPDANTIHITIEEAHLLRLHQALEQQRQVADRGDGRAGRESNLVDSITAYVAEHLRMDLMGANVTQIITPTGELSSAGEVRFYWPSHLKRAMFNLRQVCNGNPV